MMGVMKQEDIVTVALMMRPNTADEFRLVPFVHEHQLNAIQQTLESQPCQRVGRATQVRVCLTESAQRCRPMLGHEIDQAPAGPGLKHADLVSTGLQFIGNTPEEMRIAVIPIRTQRMVKQGDLHAATMLCWAEAI